MKKVTSEQIKHRMKFENPWFDSPHQVPSAFAKYRSRTYLTRLYPLLKDHFEVRRAVVLLGPRRVGKTVLIHHAIAKLIEDGIDPKSICYISVDHPIYTGLDLEQLLHYYTSISNIDVAKDRCWIFFDEIQYLKGWELYLKKIVDDHPNIKCLVSGSAAAALKLQSSESGAGRFTDFLLPPLTFHEYLYLQDQHNLVQVKEDTDEPPQFATKDIDLLNEKFLHYVNFGGYPELIFSPEIQADPSRFIKSDIIDKVLLRDLPSLYGINEIQELNYLFTTLAFNTANEISLEALSKGSGLAKNTIKKYIEYLEAAFLIRCVHRIDINARRFRRANFFKVYLTNPSMRAALFEPISFKDEAIGDLIETAVYSQWFHASTSNLHYARWRHGEVDIVNLGTKAQEVSWAVEIKYTDKPYKSPASELKNVINFCHTNNCASVIVTSKTITDDVRFKNVLIEFVPASLYCYILGYNIIRSKTITAPKQITAKR